jgi:amidase
LLDAGNNMPGARAAATRRIMDEARAGGADAVLDNHNVDVLVIPTTPCLPPTIDETHERPASGRIVSLTGVIDFTGQPAIAVPCGLAEGLPASVSFVGRRWDEPSILRAARAHEQIRGAFPMPNV